MAKLTLQHANTMIEQALKLAREKNYARLGVVVLDESGNLKAAALEDGATAFRIDVAKGKAWGAVQMSCSSRALAKKAKENPNFMVALAATAGGRFLPQQGAALIRDADGTPLGAVGISGASGDQDEECAAHGIEKAGFKADVAA